MECSDNMELTKEEVLHQIEFLRNLERSFRRDLVTYNEQFNKIVSNIEYCRKRIEDCEKKRFGLEATLIPVKKCKPHESGHTKKRSPKVTLRQALYFLSKEERQALLAELTKK